MPTIIHIRQLVRGMPLAIELAASWLRVLTLEDIATEIEKGIFFLEASTRDIPARHRSIRAVFDYSWELLTEEEREVLRKLSVFRGGFRREAAAEVAGASLAVLASLVDKSFLTFTPAGRYRRHPLVLQYTQEKLSEHPEEKAQAEEKHGLYYLRFVREREKDLRTRERKATLAVLEEELANVRVAWTWAIENKRIDEIRAFALALGNAYENRMAEGVNLFAQVVTALDEHNPAYHGALGYALVQEAWYSLWLTRNKEAIVYAQRGLKLLKPLDEVRGAMKGLASLGWSTWLSGDFAQAKATLLEGLALAKRYGRASDINDFLVPLGLVEREFGSFSQVQHFYQQALAEVKESGDLITQVHLLHSFGTYLTHHNLLQEGRMLLQESLELTRELNYRVDEPFILDDLAMTLLKLGDYDHAEALALETLSVAVEVADRFAEAKALAKLGRVATAHSDYAQAQRHLKLSLQLTWNSAAVFGVLDALLFLAELYVAQDKSREAAELLSLVRHHPTARDEHKTDLQHLLNKLHKRLSPQELEEALERGKQMKLEEVVEEILKSEPSSATESSL